MKKYGFNIAGIDNEPNKIQQTKVITYGQKYDETIKTLQYFFPINNIERGQVAT